jgi:guanosine-3',5'-bis(diphosphate) 3'-pyrophosphohydrolase
MGAEASPYVNHVIRVALLLARIGGVRDVELLQAAILHDTIEDTRTTPDELEQRFGARVRALVEEVTDDKRLPRADRKRLQIEHAPTLSAGARQIKVADKIANVQDVAHAPPRDWSVERRVAYLDWAEAVVRGCRGTNPALDHYWNEVVTNARLRLSAATP